MTVAPDALCEEPLVGKGHERFFSHHHLAGRLLAGGQVQRWRDGSCVGLT